MSSSIIGTEQRLELIRWHAAACPDGNRKSGIPWKTRLAEELGVSEASVSNMVNSGRPVNPTSVGEKVKRKLAQAADEAFLAILGFRREMQSRSKGGGATNREFAARIARVRTLDEYVDLCAGLRIELNPEHRAAAADREAVRRTQTPRDRALWRSSASAYWYVPCRPEPDSATAGGVPLHDVEIEAVQKLFSSLTGGRGTSKTAIVDALPYSGIAYALQAALHKCPTFGTYYRGGVHHIHVGALEYPYHAKKVLKKKLGLGDGSSGTLEQNSTAERKIAYRLHGKQELLIIHGASAIPDHAVEFISNLSRELEDNPGALIGGGVSRLILTTWDVSRFEFLNRKHPIKCNFGFQLGPEEARTYFGIALEHYRAVRGKVSKVAAGPRAENPILKRAAHHYRTKATAYTDMPSAIRFRAFCASDRDNPSPFDPTQGVWDRIDAKWREEVPEITDCITDIQSDLRTLGGVLEHSTARPEGPPDDSLLAAEAKGDLSALRTVSTGLFFLSERMLQNLKHHPVSKAWMSPVEMSFSLQSKYVSRDQSPSSELDLRYSTPLLVRAIVQDDWMRFDPASRTIVHEAIADQLCALLPTDAQNDISEELPYEMPWGDSDVVVALEAIRHFSRAAASANPSKAIELTRRALDVYDKYLEEGTFSPADEEASRQNAGRLSRSHGLHALKHEALSLLSADGRGAQAPRGANLRQQYTFFREMGITLARLLRPDEAISAFERCLALDGLELVDRSSVLSHAVSASILRGNLSEAQDYLNASRETEKQEADPETCLTIATRNNARAAALALARGRRYEARERWEAIAETGMTPFVGDRAISYFDAQLATACSLRRNAQMADKLLAAMERASHVALDRQLEHERLRIDIRKASWARVMGFPAAAESVLDHVGLDLTRHTGAEILFREFQIESAETLMSLERPRYAFVAYAWPAFLSLRRRASAPYTRRCRRLCGRLLIKMDSIIEEPEPSTQNSKFWQEISKIESQNVYPFYSVDLLPAREDVESYFQELATPESRIFYRQILHESL